MTTPLDAEAREIAGKLSEAQRQMMVGAEPRELEEWPLFINTTRANEKIVCSLVNAGLVFIVVRGAMLNEKGLAVRAILSEQGS